MSANEKSKYDVTARALAEYCVKKQTCLSNVLYVINRKQYDIIGIQEGVNIDKFRQSLVHHCINTSIQNVRQDFVNITTFYSDRFRCEKIYFGIVTDLNDVRPYQIILFEDKESGTFFYFINIHNTHNIDRIQLEEVLNSNKLYYTPDNVNVDMVIPYSDDMTSILKSKTDEDIHVNGMMFQHDIKNIFPIIMCGDFNDNNLDDKNYWKRLTINTLELTSGIEPPKSCCTPTKRDPALRITGENKNDNKSGDYFITNGTFIQHNTISTISNLIFHANLFPTSDHLPVEAIIQLVTSGGRRSRKTKRKSKRKSSKYRKSMNQV